MMHLARRASSVALLLLVVAVVGMASPMQSQASAPRTVDSRPNILLVVADDLGFSDLGAYGSEIETPALDRLAARGMLLTNFHAGATCSPTRAMLLTGVDHHRAGLGSMAEALRADPARRGKPGYEGHLNQRVVTVAELLRDAGYSTQMVGKWHLGYEPPDLPPARGFEHSFVLLPGGAQHFNAASAVPGDPESTLREDGREASWPAGRYSSDYYTDRMLEYLRAAPRNRPFFAYVAYTAPHWPLQAPAEYLKKYAGRYAAGWDAIRAERLARMQRLGLGVDPARAAPRPAQVPAWSQLTPEQQARAARAMEIYAAMVDNLDDNVARLLEELRRLGRDRNTLIVFMSDNGAEAMEPGAGQLPGLKEWVASTFDNSLDNMGRARSYVAYGPGWAHVSGTPFRGFKGSAYEGGTHTAAFVVVPGAHAGRSDRYVRVLDLAPTLLRFAGVTPPGTQYRGRSVYALEGQPFLKTTGEIEPGDPQRVSGQELFGHRGIQRGSLKAVSAWAGPRGSLPWQLFDLAGDAAEQRDLGAARPEDLGALTSLYEQWAQERGVLATPNNGPSYATEK